ncbi:MAG: 50S ribosomal protein L3 [Candidatus Omnitrophica bacterium]|nr:50S ribosomal protein L3 [Candidatus Omnitrophota bacterium]MDD5429162.1 50S ribosomal protein L3 [Candidatus Omnitrophota bacterium]
MIKEIYGKKIGMTQVFDEAGNMLATTLIEVEPVYALEKVDYPSGTKLKIGCFPINALKASKVKKPVQGYFKKLGVDFYKYIKEVAPEEGTDLSFKLKPENEPQGEAKAAPKESSDEEKIAKEANAKDPNSESQLLEQEKEAKMAKDEPNKVSDPRKIGIEIFKEGDIVDIRAKTKGKGFAGGMKRYGWAGQPGSHGSTTHRRIGSTGSSAYPSRIIKGLHMPGHMGDCFRTVKKLKVLSVDKEKNILFVSGCVPGSRGAVVKIIKV